MKTIIVTGGAGFIGANFVYHMLGKYPDYRIIWTAVTGGACTSSSRRSIPMWW